jgi:hydroxymethylbilane synthase
VGRHLKDLPVGAKIGTSSLRRAAQLRQARPDLLIETLRGNLDTRLRKLDEGRYDAVVLAAAGLKRLGWEKRITELLPAEIMCPAVGQGALAIETGHQGAGREACAGLEDANTRAAVTAERGVLAALGGGCQVPIGAYAIAAEGHLQIQAVVIAPDGTEVVRGQADGAMAEAAHLGGALGAELLDRGARKILDAVYSL